MSTSKEEVTVTTENKEESVLFIFRGVLTEKLGDDKGKMYEGESVESMRIPMSTVVTVDCGCSCR